MEERRRRLGKSPAIPISLPPRARARPQPFTMMAPTTLSKAFEMPSSSRVMSHSRAVGNIVFSPETSMVDLNVPLPVSEVDGFSPPQNRYSVSPAVRSAPSRIRQNVLTLDEAFEREQQIDGSKSDLKKLRRTISNRLSAQRSRMRKAQYIVEMEKKIKDLQDTISVLHPQIENYKNKQRALRIQRVALEQQLYNCITKSNLCDIQIEENKLEVQRLKELQKMQREQMMFAANFGRQMSSFNMYGLLPGSSIIHQRPEEPDTTSADHAAADEYINFDALNLHPNKNLI